MPSVNTLYREFKGKGFEVLLVSFREDPELVKQTVQGRGYMAPVLLDRSGEVSGKVYGVWGTPTVYVINRLGLLVGHAIGPRAWESPEAREFIRRLLETGAKR